MGAVAALYDDHPYQPPVRDVGAFALGLDMTMSANENTEH